MIWRAMEFHQELKLKEIPILASVLRVFKGCTFGGYKALERRSWAL
jgi:hypothetical protein